MMAARLVLWRTCTAAVLKCVTESQAPSTIHRQARGALWRTASRDSHLSRPRLIATSLLHKRRFMVDSADGGTEEDGEEKLSELFIDEETLRMLNPDYDKADPRDKLVDDTSESSSTGFKGKFNPAKLELPLVHVKATYNNTIITITDAKGKVLGWTSAGACGFKNARRGTTFAAQSAGSAAAQKAHGFGIKRVHVKLKGPGPGRQPSLKGLELGGLQVVTIQDVTPIPHNGCRPRKARRL